MVQILPPKTDLGTSLGQALSSGLGSGLQIGIQRGMLQNAMGGLENLPKNTTPFQLASKLIQATAGIPGAERYVGTLYPLLLQQMQNEAFLGPQSGSQAGGMVPAQGQIPGIAMPQTEGGQSLPGRSAQELTPGLQNKPSTSGGILGDIISQDQINSQATQYARATNTGLQGYSQMQQHLMNLNTIAEQQRGEAEARAKKIAPDDTATVMQLGERHRFAKNFDEWERKTERDYREFRNLTKRLDAVSYPGLFTGIAEKTLKIPGMRESRLKELDNTVGRLVNLGFEQNVRRTLADKGLSPAEIEERIHPFTPEQKKSLDNLPSIQEGKGAQENAHARLVKFLKKNIDPNVSLLALRQRLWEDKHYSPQEISRAMEEATTGDNPAELSTAQVNELNVLQTEPPRQSLSSIFRDWGGFGHFIRGEK